MFAVWDDDTVMNEACWTEVQFSSQQLARQLHYRYRPDMILVDVRHSVFVAELVSVIACMRIGAPFCPVDTDNQHGGKRLQTVVDTLLHSARGSAESQAPLRIAAIVLAVR